MLEKNKLKQIPSTQTFTFNKNSYDYFHHEYNQTWSNERAVEIPIILRRLENNSGKNILEIGNVLSHYINIKHQIVDKYEKGRNVVNKDVTNFHSNEKYDLIISISTLEHIGWDEEPKEPGKILQAISNLKRYLTRRGIMIVTLPLGYNSFMDDLIASNKIKFQKMSCLKRITDNNQWVQANWKEICGSEYGKPFPFANGLIVGIFKRRSIFG